MSAHSWHLLAGIVPLLMVLTPGSFAVWFCMKWLHNQDRKQWLDDVTYRKPIDRW